MTGSRGGTITTIVGTVKERKSMEGNFAKVKIEVATGNGVVDFDLTVTETDHIALLGKQYTFVKSGYTDSLGNEPVFTFLMYEKKPRRWGLW